MLMQIAERMKGRRAITEGCASLLYQEGWPLTSQKIRRTATPQNTTKVEISKRLTDPGSL